MIRIKQLFLVSNFTLKIAKVHGQRMYSAWPMHVQCKANAYTVHEFHMHVLVLQHAHCMHVTCMESILNHSRLQETCMQQVIVTCSKHSACSNLIFACNTHVTCSIFSSRKHTIYLRAAYMHAVNGQEWHPHYL